MEHKTLANNKQTANIFFIIVFYLKYRKANLRIYYKTNKKKF